MEKKSGFKDFLASSAGRVVIIAVMYVVIFGLMLGALGTNNNILMFIVTAACVYFGWRALDNFRPNIILMMPLAGWAIYYVIKFVLSIFIGEFVAPFQIAKMITNAIQKNV